MCTKLSKLNKKNKYMKEILITTSLQLVCLFCGIYIGANMLCNDSNEIETNYKRIFGNYNGIVYDSTLWNGYTIVDTLLTNEKSVSVRFIKK